jgi:glycine C-acetyltransferase
MIAASMKAIELVRVLTAPRNKLAQHTAWFRCDMTEAGFEIRPSMHPGVPVMLYCVRLA